MIDCERCWTNPQRCNTRQQQTFSNMVNVSVFNIGSICMHGKELLRNFTVHQKYRRSHNETDVRHIWEIDIRTITWDLCSDSNKPGKFFMETIIFDGWWTGHQSLAREGFVFSDSVLCFGKMNENPQSNTVWEDKLTWFKKFITIQSFGHNWWWANGIRVEYFPRIHHIALQQSPRVPDKNERKAKRIYRTDHLHVDVQRHLMVI